MKEAKGYMTVELIVALIVGAILFLSLNNIVTSNSYLSQRSRDLMAANAFAEQKVESLRSAGYLTLIDGTNDISSELPDELNNPRTGTLVVSSQSTSIKKVHMTISYNEQGTSRTHSYTTYIGELGVGQ